LREHRRQLREEAEALAVRCGYRFHGWGLERRRSWLRKRVK
jgi:hypothetical protein